MRKIQIGIVMLILLLTTGCSQRVSNLFSDSDTVTLEGTIENTIITASSTVSGQIIEMKKDLGEPVKKGDVIAVIKHEDQQYTVEQLKAMVNMKKATLEGLKAGARPQQIEQAQAQVNAAKAKFSELQAGTRPQQIEQAQAQVNAAKAKLSEVKAGTRPQQIEQAKAQVRAAKAQYDLVASGNRKEQIKQAKNNVSIARNALNAQQLTYNHINKRYKNTLALYNEGIASKNELDTIKYELDTAQKQLSTLKSQLDSSEQQLTLLQKGSPAEEVRIAAANLDAAKAQLKLLQSGATEQSIRAAQAGVDQAIAQLKLLQSGATEQSIRAAQAEVDQATAQLKLLQSGSTKQAIKTAQSDVDQAVAQLKQAQSKLESYYIKALEDGIIISKNFELGDVVNIGSQIADIATNDTHVLIYLPVEYLDKVFYNQSLSVKTSVGVQKGRVSYIDLEDEYTPEDKKSTNESKSVATKIKVKINDDKGKLKSGMTAEVNVPLK